MPDADHPPAFLFYPADFANDGKVEAMTTEEVGAYILLLCKSWREVPVGSLPTDDRVLAKWARLTPDRWAEAKSSVMAAFSMGRDSRWHQKRLRSEFDKLTAARSRRVEAGKVAASKRWEKPSDPCDSHSNRIAIASDSDAISSSSSSSLGASPPDPPGARGRARGPEPPSAEKSSKKPGGTGPPRDPPGFVEFWNAYPAGGRKVDRAGTCRAWHRAGCEGIAADVLAGLARWRESRDWNRDGGAYVCAPSVFVNQRRWEARPSPATPADERAVDDMGCAIHTIQDRATIHKILDEVFGAA